jgi:hypothetical protein
VGWEAHHSLPSISEIKIVRNCIHSPIRLYGAVLNCAQGQDLICVGFEVLTAVAMKSTIFWDITPCSPLKVNRRFGGTYRHHLQDLIISRGRNQRESRWQAEPFCLSWRYIPEDSILQDLITLSYLTNFCCRILVYTDIGQSIVQTVRYT